MRCPYCGSEDTKYWGITDGNGDYGDEMCDEYECYECGEIFAENCVEITEEHDRGGVIFTENAGMYFQNAHAILSAKG